MTPGQRASVFVKNVSDHGDQVESRATVSSVCSGGHVTSQAVIYIASGHMTSNLHQFFNPPRPGMTALCIW